MKVTGRISAFDAAAGQIVDEVDGLRTDAIAAAATALEVCRSTIRDELDRIPATGIDLLTTRRVKAASRAPIEALTHRLHQVATSYLRKAWNLGTDLIEHPLSAAGVTVAPLGHVAEAEAFTPAQLLAVLEHYTADLITALGDEARRRISGILARAALGQLTSHEAVRLIAGALDSPSVFRTLEGRAQAIFRTEIGRTFSAAGQLRMAEMGSRLPGLAKSWLAVNDERTRPTHRIANGQVVPVDEYFTVGGERALYPRDPLLSAKESVNCRCTAIPKVTAETFAHLGVSPALIP